MKMYLRVLQKATTWPLRLCMIILDTFYWLHNHIKHTKRPNRQCWRFFEPKSPKSRSLIQSPEIVENLMVRAAEKDFFVEKICFLFFYPIKLGQFSRKLVSKTQSYPQKKSLRDCKILAFTDWNPFTIPQRNSTDLSTYRIGGWKNIFSSNFFKNSFTE